MGVIRSTFLIENGQILESWKNIRAKGHAERILKAMS
jgi:peroxiredoxin